MRPLDVALACSGLKMLMTLAATVTATVMLLPMPRWKRIVLLLSAVPIALISNITRIVTTGWCYYYIEGKTQLGLLSWSKDGLHWAHDISGWMMMPLALILVGLELQLLSWLTPPMIQMTIGRRSRRSWAAGKAGKGSAAGPDRRRSPRAAREAGPTPRPELAITIYEESS